MGTFLKVSWRKVQIKWLFGLKKRTSLRQKLLTSQIPAGRSLKQPRHLSVQSGTRGVRLLTIKDSTVAMNGVAIITYLGFALLKKDTSSLVLKKTEMDT